MEDFLGRALLADVVQCVAGPTCDSMDVLYEKNLVRLPADVREGDRLYLFTTGAYTQTYSAVFFNGFPPLKSYVLD